MKEIQKNIRFIGALILIAFAAMFISYAVNVYTQGTYWASGAYNSRTKNNVFVRGDIIDRNGIVLATTDDEGNRVYLENVTARRALSQVVGDTRSMAGNSIECYKSAVLMDVSTSLGGRLRELISGKKHRGSDIKLTIDAQLQTYVSHIFPEGMQGCVCIMNYKTGEILCMVSKDDYDPMLINSDPEAVKYVTEGAFLNKCLQGCYTPGSIFKIITLASVLEYMPEALEEKYSCEGLWDYTTGDITCASGAVHGIISLKTAFAKSCNIVYGRMAYTLGADKLVATAEKFGFNENFKFGDFMIYSSNIPEDIADANELIWSGVGQGQVTVTPMHMTMISAAIANGGMMLRPYLIESTTTETGFVTGEGSTKQLRQVLSYDDARTIAHYMRETVDSGTAREADIPGYIVCGKTGSAQTSDNDEVETTAWFTGFVYDDECPYAISVVVEQGGSGGAVAAPIAREALKKAIEK